MLKLQCYYILYFAQHWSPNVYTSQPLKGSITYLLLHLCFRIINFGWNIFNFPESFTFMHLFRLFINNRIFLESFIFKCIIKVHHVQCFLSFSGDLVNLGSEYMCDFSQGTCNWTASVGKMKWIQSQVVWSKIFT